MVSTSTPLDDVWQAYTAQYANSDMAFLPYALILYLIVDGLASLLSQELVCEEDSPLAKE